MLCLVSCVCARTRAQIIVEAASGNLDNLIKLAASGEHLDVCDYDHRSPLHLAASNGHADVVTYLLAQAGDNATQVKVSALARVCLCLY